MEFSQGKQAIRGDQMEYLKMKNAVHDKQITFLMDRISQQSEEITRHDEQIDYLMNKVSQSKGENPGSHTGKL